MIEKHIFEKRDGCFSSYEQVIDEPITNNIENAISDFYNMMHLIENSWANENYELKMRDAGYDIYNKEEKQEAWIGIREKTDQENIGNYLVFLVYCYGNMAKKIWKRFDADGSGISVAILYSQLSLNDILKEKTEAKQREIIQIWINKVLKKLL